MAKQPPVKILSATGTMYFVEHAGGLRQAYDLALRNAGPACLARVWMFCGGREHACGDFEIAEADAVIRLYVPDVREPGPMTFTLRVGDAEAEFTINHQPRRHWMVHMVQFAHHDLGYTGLPSQVLREYLGFYDDILRFCRETDDFPDGSKFRYTIEQGWSLLHFLEHRPPEVCEEMIRRINEGRIEVNAFIGNEITELLGPEEMVRMLYPVFALKRKHGIPVVTAEHNDIVGMSWGVAEVMPGAGIRYLSPGLPNYFRWFGKDYHEFWDEQKIIPGNIPHAFYWAAPDGGKTLVWCHTQGAGGDADTDLRNLPGFLGGLEERGYPYDVVRYQTVGTHRDNSSPTIGFARATREWNAKWAYPRLLMSLNSTFFPELEKQLGPDIKIWRGELPGTDYPAAASSTAYTSSLNRVTHDRLLAAERFAAVAFQATDFAYPTESIDEAYYCALLSDEHTWGMAHPAGPIHEACVAQLSEFAYRAAALAEDVLTSSVEEIAACVQVGDDTPHALVFNALNWPRTDIVTVQGLPIPDGEFQIIDVSTGKSLPHEVHEVTSPLAPVPYAACRYSMGQYDAREKLEVRFVAEDIPSVGYKVYRFAPGRLSDTEDRVVVGKNTLENKFYKIELDPATGGIASIYDKELGRELADREAEHRLGQIVVRSSITADVLTSGRAVIECSGTGPVSGSLIVKTEAYGYPQITQEIILYSQLKRIDICIRTLKDPLPQIETFFAFPFAFSKPKFRYEGTLSVIEPLVDQFPGSNSDYHAVQHWADVYDTEFGVTLCSLDSPIMQFGGNYPLYISQAHHGYTPPNFDHPFHTAEDIKKGHIYSFVLLNNYRTNFTAAQSGDLLFRYSITSHAGDWKHGRSRDFGYAVSLPLVAAEVGRKQEGRLPPAYSFCQIDADNVLLLALKRAEDANGFIVRVIETEGEDTQTTITFPLILISEAFETDLVEENLRPLSFKPHSVTAHVKAWGMGTVRIVGKQLASDGVRAGARM